MQFVINVWVYIFYYLWLQVKCITFTFKLFSVVKYFTIITEYKMKILSIVLTFDANDSFSMLRKKHVLELLNHMNVSKITYVELNDYLEEC